MQPNINAKTHIDMTKSSASAVQSFPKLLICCTPSYKVGSLGVKPSLRNLNDPHNLAGWVKIVIAKHSFAAIVLAESISGNLNLGHFVTTDRVDVFDIEKFASHSFFPSWKLFFRDQLLISHISIIVYVRDTLGHFMKYFIILFAWSRLPSHLTLPVQMETIATRSQRGSVDASLRVLIAKFDRFDIVVFLNGVLNLLY